MDNGMPHKTAGIRGQGGLTSKKSRHLLGTGGEIPHQTIAGRKEPRPIAEEAMSPGRTNSRIGGDRPMVIGSSQRFKKATLRGKIVGEIGKAVNRRKLRAKTGKVKSRWKLQTKVGETGSR